MIGDRRAKMAETITTAANRIGAGVIASIGLALVGIVLAIVALARGGKR